MGFPGGSEVKASACPAGDLGSIPGSGRSPREGNGNPLQYPCLENPMVGCSAWDPEELDRAERLHFHFHFHFHFLYTIFPGDWEVKASASNAGDLGSIPGSARFLWRRQWHPTPVLLPGESHGRRSLVGCSPRGRKELDATERLHFHFHSVYCICIFNGATLFSWLPSGS